VRTNTVTAYLLQQNQLFPTAIATAFRPGARRAIGPERGTNTVTAYLLQQIQLFPHRDRHGLPPWSPTGNRTRAGTDEMTPQF
jgi:hypothetical protein